MIRYTCLLILFAIFSQSLEHASADDSDRDALPKPEFSAQIGLGLEYDSNIAIEELDRTSNESDYAYILDAEIAMSQKLGSNMELDLSYDLNLSKYNQYSQVDRQTHIAAATLSRKGRSVDSSISGYYVNSRLDGNDFLELYRASPSVSGFLSKRVFARSAYVYSRKSINNRPGRDARTDAGEGDIYFFHRGLRSYFNVGYRFKHEEADADRLDFTSNSIKFRYIRRVELFSKLAKMEFAWRYENRDYANTTPSIGEEREDSRNRWSVDMELPLYRASAMQIYLGYSDYDSNLSQADYDQGIIGMKYLYRF